MQATSQVRAREGEQQPASWEMSCHTTFLLKKPVEHEKSKNTRLTPMNVVFHNILRPKPVWNDIRRRKREWSEQYRVTRHLPDISIYTYVMRGFEERFHVAQSQKQNQVLFVHQTPSAHVAARVQFPIRFQFQFCLLIKFCFLFFCNQLI